MIIRGIARSLIRQGTVDGGGAPPGPGGGDEVAERFSWMNVGAVGWLILAFPDGTIDADDRRQALGIYAPRSA